MAEIMESVRDVEDWLNNYRYDVFTIGGGSAAVRRAADAIWRDPMSPPAGADWAEWLRSAEVSELITEAVESGN